MENLVANDAYCQFAYILPMDPYHALIEITRFSTVAESPASLESLARQRVAQFSQDYQILRRESAILPMGIKRYRQNTAPLYHLAQQYGSLRASSSYGFLRLQRQAQALAQQIASQHAFTGAKIDGFLDRWMDDCFCRVLVKQMPLAPKLFLQMASKMPAAQFAHFMNGEIDWPLRLNVIKAMPTTPFLRALV